jgi:F0F1-type ATP synthase membrane subunit b/b'
MEMAGQGTYRQLAEEIGEVLQAAAETAEKMVEDARAEALRIQGEAEAERRVAFAESRRILDDARMESDMMRAEAEWQAQEIIAQARRHAAERMAGADARLADLEKAETRVIDRLAGVGQVLADTMASLREGPAIADIAASAPTTVDPPTAKVFFVEFPPAEAASGHPAGAEPEADREIVLSDAPGASLFADDEERSEWAPPANDLPTWWTRGGAQA